MFLKLTPGGTGRELHRHRTSSYPSLRLTRSQPRLAGEGRGSEIVGPEVEVGEGKEEEQRAFAPPKAGPERQGAPWTGEGSKDPGGGSVGRLGRVDIPRWGSPVPIGPWRRRSERRRGAEQRSGDPRPPEPASSTQVARTRTLNDLGTRPLTRGRNPSRTSPTTSVSVLVRPSWRVATSLLLLYL